MDEQQWQMFENWKAVHNALPDVSNELANF